MIDAIWEWIRTANPEDMEVLLRFIERSSPENYQRLCDLAARYVEGLSNG